MTKSELTCVLTELTFQQHLGQEALHLTAELLGSSSPDDQLHSRLYAVTHQVSGLGVRFEDGRVEMYFSIGKRRQRKRLGPLLISQHGVLNQNETKLVPFGGSLRLCSIFTGRTYR